MNKSVFSVLGNFFRASGIFISFLFIPAMSVTSPFLNSVVAQSSRIALVSWRNNDIGTESFVIQRRNIDSLDFKIVATVKAPATSYVDSLLMPSAKYVFRLFAVAAKDTSLPSNEDTVQMLPAKVGMHLSNCDYDSLSRCIKLNWQDSCESENGFIIFRSESPNLDSFSKQAEIHSSNPLTMGMRTWTDSNTIPNRMCRYMVQASIASVYSPPSYFTTNIFPLDYANLISPNDTLLVMDSIKWGFPIHFNHYKKWAIIAGDSLFLSEDSAIAPYTILNISNPKGPSFEGYGQYPINADISTSSLIVGLNIHKVGFDTFYLWTYDKGFHQRMLFKADYCLQFPTAFQFIGDSAFFWASLYEQLNYCRILPDTVKTYDSLAYLPHTRSTDIPYGKVWKRTSYIQIATIQVITSLDDFATCRSNYLFDLNRIPDQLNTYCVIDTFKNVKKRILDDKRKIVYSFCDSVLWAYSYKLVTKKEYDLTPVVNPKHASKGQKEAVKDDGYYEIYDLLGRRILSSFRKSNAFLQLNRGALRPQMFIVVFRNKNSSNAFVKYGRLDDILLKLKTGKSIK